MLDKPEGMSLASAPPPYLTDHITNCRFFVAPQTYWSTLMLISFSSPARKLAATRNNLKETLLREDQIRIPMTNKRSERMIVKVSSVNIHNLGLNAGFLHTELTNSWMVKCFLELS